MRKDYPLNSGNFAGTLNIYTTKADGNLGYAYYPSAASNIESRTDNDVVIQSESAPGGNLAGVNEGDTLVHEVGHWLGLPHTFDDGCSGGDGIGDTPEVAQPNYGCPDGQNGRPSPPDSCPNDGLGPDQYWNYMDYVDDFCSKFFEDILLLGSGFLLIGIVTLITSSCPTFPCSVQVHRGSERSHACPLATVPRRCMGRSD